MDNKFSCLNCGGYTPLIERECGNCISARKKIEKLERTALWRAMTKEQRIDYKFSKAGF